jgi:hypothetical protein
LLKIAEQGKSCLRLKFGKKKNPFNQSLPLHPFFFYFLGPAVLCAAAPFQARLFASVLRTSR